MNILKFIQDNLPVIQDYNQGNVQLIPSYKKQLSAHLLIIGNGNLDTQNRIKVYKEFYRGFLDKYQLKELANMLCAYANCQEKISKMHSYINEM